jgi:hypothetical protein
MVDLKTAQQALEALRGYRREMQAHQPCDAEVALEAALAQPEQEPVAWIRKRDNRLAVNDGGIFDGDWTPLYTHPPRREWRGLTEGEINALWPAPRCEGHDKAFARAIEAALKEKNA